MLYKTKRLNSYLFFLNSTACSCHLQRQKNRTTESGVLSRKKGGKMSVYSNNSLVEYFVSERDAAKDTSTESAIFSIKVTEKLHKIN